MSQNGPPHDALHAWHELLDAAGDGGQVLDIARRFVAELEPSDVSSLPPECRPGSIDHESDIDYWNLRYADECRDLWGTDRDGRVLTELSKFFLRASVRLSRISEVTHS
jgi:hypothetical protein